MELLNEIGVTPISVSNPVGTSPQYGDRYYVISQEIDKLNSIYSESIDWALIAKKSSEILLEEGKDFKVATWLLYAMYRIEGITGLCCGTLIVKDLLSYFWDSMFPPVDKLRARRNQLEWLINRLEKDLASVSDTISAECISELTVTWKWIADFWYEKDNDAPNISRMYRLFRTLPQESPQGIKDARSIDVPSSEVENLGVHDTVVAEEKTTAEENNDFYSESINAGDIDTQSCLWHDLSSVEKKASEIFAILNRFVVTGLEKNFIFPLWYRLNRQAAWAYLVDSPPAIETVTRIPPPPPQQIESFNRINDAGNPIDVINFCEARLITYPFWLDLNRASFDALSKLGAEAKKASEIIEQEVRYVISRLSGLELLKFSDEMPFADKSTRFWLSTFNHVESDIVTKSQPDDIEMFFHEAIKLVTNDRLDAGIKFLKNKIDTASSERERYQFRFAICKLVDRFSSETDISMLLELLTRIADKHELKEWEPALIEPVIVLGLSRSSHDTKNKWAERLAELDFETYLKLMQEQK
ncbi:type VI secretion system protein TssA [Citrobacter sp. RHBSTW-00671]|uniref:type VI secretion system protein TssA n=1 Tax=Citrobacter sp. RHBSTW-00671 TaxID=2742660 RepID=UPI0017CFF687|nr:type VI secretion system protein TssA [Citrobacter sp. RHBSTW-00671]MBA7966548.1 type VI secretion system protein TssA [Citrobacter sp. RHBSTW-00671]